MFLALGVIHGLGLAAFIIPAIEIPLSVRKQMKGDKLLAEGNFAGALENYLDSAQLIAPMGLEHRKIGYAYEMFPAAQATEKYGRDYFKAVVHYQLAVSNGYPQANEDVQRMLGRNDLSPETCLAIGNLYHRGCNDIALLKGKGVTPDLSIAKKMYLLAAQKGLSVGFWHIGAIEEKNHNDVEAAKYYQKAIDAGYTAAKEDLNRLLHAYDLDGTTIYNIAMLYINNGGVREDYREHIKLLKMAMRKGCATAFSAYGCLLQSGTGGLARDMFEAARYYRQAEARGCIHAMRLLNDLFPIADEETKAYLRAPEDMATLRINPHIRKKALKKIFCSIVHNHFLRNRSCLVDVERIDQRHWTLLHHASMYRPGQPLHKVCARLCCLGANIERVNGDGHRPFRDFLVDSNARVDQYEKVTNLRNGLDTLLTNLEAYAPDIMGLQLVSHAGAIAPDVRAEFTAALEKLYDTELLRPLLNLTKLACLGLYDSGALRRARYTNTDYDSDNDDAAEIVQTEQLRFILDPTRVGVDNIAPYIIQQDRNSFGMYFQTNEIYIGALQNANGARAQNEIRGTFIHELTHFVALEVYNNSCKPYASGDSTNRVLFSQIADELRQKQMSLPQQLLEAFTCYDLDKQHNELIVRVAQMFAEDPVNARTVLTQTAPRLLNYYEHAFLPAVRAHCKSIEERALGGWPRELFTAVRPSNVVAFQRGT